jgi:16S rRNA (adenine1518-N6/adenine1519-N6)-dimethyltransferase
MPNKLLGQHFLDDPSVVAKIIKALDLKAGDTVFEIGAGHGELTFPLAQACKENGVELFAIEKDRELAAALRENPGAKDVTVVTADALKFFEDAPARSKQYKIVGNIPYYITGHLLRIVSELPIKPERCVLMMQKEVAERLAAEPPKMNRLAASVQFWAKAKTITAVSRQQFTPPPEVDSVVIALEAIAGNTSIKSEDYYRAVRILFAQPRKTVLNNLAAGEGKGSGTKEKAAAALMNAKVDPAARPQNLSVKDIVAIAKAAFWG